MQFPLRPVHMWMYALKQKYLLSSTMCNVFWYILLKSILLKTNKQTTNPQTKQADPDSLHWFNDLLRAAEVRRRFREGPSVRHHIPGSDPQFCWSRDSNVSVQSIILPTTFISDFLNVNLFISMCGSWMLSSLSRAFHSDQKGIDHPYWRMEIMVFL